MAARIDQDLNLVAVQKTSSVARVDQDLFLLAISEQDFLPVLPIAFPGQNTSSPPNTFRGPSWSVKKSAEYSSILQHTTAGRTTVVTLARNPLWHWEFTFEVILDDPNRPNAFFTIPFPATDMEELTSFYSSVQGAGTFAYQPPDSARGGNFVATSVNVPTNGLAAITTDGTTPVTNLKLGDVLVGNNFTSATYLNGASATVVGINPLISAFTVSVVTSGTHALVSDTGNIVGGQLLSVDVNNYVELVNTIGTYPLTISTSPSTRMAVESVQLIDVETLAFYSNGVFFPNYKITRDFSKTGRALYITKGQGIAPYSGVTVQFQASTTAPVTASFNYYYLCKFSDDTQEFENFTTTLWANSAIKIQQTKH